MGTRGAGVSKGKYNQGTKTGRFDNKHNKSETGRKHDGKKELKFGTHNRKASLDSYSNAKKHIIHVIQEQNTEVRLEIATALQEMTEYDFNAKRSTLKVSNATDSTVKEHEARENEITYEKELEQWIETKKKY